MDINDEILMIGDRVFYTGERFKTKLGGKPGWLHVPVHNQPGVWVCEFPDTRDPKVQSDSDDYIFASSKLTKKNLSKERDKKEGPEVQPRRRRKMEEEAT